MPNQKESQQLSKSSRTGLLSAWLDSWHGRLPWSLDLLQPHGQHGQLGTEGRGVDGLQQGIPRASGFGKNTAKFGLVGLLFFPPPITNFQGSKHFVIWWVA